MPTIPHRTVELLTGLVVLEELHLPEPLLRFCLSLVGAAQVSSGFLALDFVSSLSFHNHGSLRKKANQWLATGVPEPLAEERSPSNADIGALVMA